MSSSIHIDNKKKDILVLGRGPTQGLECTLTAEKMYSIKRFEKMKRDWHYLGKRYFKKSLRSSNEIF